MTYVIELHTREGRIIGSKEGTYEGRISIHHQARLWPTMQRAATMRTWYRAYVILNTNTVVCVYGREDGVLYNIGHVDACTVGQGQPYLLDPPATKVASSPEATRFSRISARDAWVDEQFGRESTATSVLLQAGRVHYAWERCGPGRELVANGRRDLSMTHKTC